MGDPGLQVGSSDCGSKGGGAEGAASSSASTEGCPSVPSSHCSKASDGGLVVLVLFVNIPAYATGAAARMTSA